MDTTDKQKARLFEHSYGRTIIGKTFIDKESRFSSPNSQLCKVLGVTPGTLQDVTVYESTTKLLSQIYKTNAKAMIQGEIDHFAIPHIFKIDSSTPVYTMISLLPVNNHKEECECLYMEVMQVSRREYIRLTKEVLMSYPQLLENQLMWVHYVLSFLRRYSLKELAEVVVRVAIVALLAVTAFQEGKAKAINMFQEIFS